MKDISLFDIKKIILAMKVLVIIITRAKLLRKQSSKKRMFYSWDKEKGLATALPTKLKRRPAFLIDINRNNLKSSLAKHSSLNSLLTAKKDVHNRNIFGPNFAALHSECTPRFTD